MITPQPKTALKTLVMLAYNFPPQSTSGAQRPARFARYLPEFGYQTEVVASPFDESKSQPHVTRVPNGKEPVSVRLASLWESGYQKFISPYNERLAWVPAAVHASSALSRIKYASAVLSTAPPVATHEAGRRLKKRLSLPWVADFRDPVLGNPFRTARRARGYYARVEAAILREADVVLANTDAFADVLRQRYPKEAHKLVVLHNGYDPEDSCRALPLPARRHRVLAHVGTLYRGRHPGRLLGSLHRLVNRGAVDPAALRVELIGPVQELTEPLDAPAGAALRQAGCLHYNGRRVTQAEARQHTATSDLLLLLDINEEDTSMQIPAKLFDYVQVGRPILAFTKRGSPTGDVLARSGVPHTAIDPSDPDDQVDRAVEDFLRLPTEPVPPSDWFVRTFDGVAQTRTLAGILDRLCATSSPGR